MKVWEITPLRFYAVEGGGWRVWLNTGARRPAIRSAPTPFDHRWRIRTNLPDRLGQPCRVTARGGAMNSVEIEFEDGERHIVSRYAVRRVS